MMASFAGPCVNQCYTRIYFNCCTHFPGLNVIAEVYIAILFALV